MTGARPAAAKPEEPPFAGCVFDRSLIARLLQLGVIDNAEAVIQHRWTGPRADRRLSLEACRLHKADPDWQFRTPAFNVVGNYHRSPPYAPGVEERVLADALAYSCSVTYLVEALEGKQANWRPVSSFAVAVGLACIPRKLAEGMPIVWHWEEGLGKQVMRELDYIDAKHGTFAREFPDDLYGLAMTFWGANEMAMPAGVG